MNSRSLIIFVKNPELGKVKTRLAATLGNDQALEIYQKLLSFTLNLTSKIKADKIIYFSSTIASGDQWSGYDTALQHGEDLGTKMHNAFVHQLKNYDAAVIIGSDCAELSADIVEDAFTQLQTNDFVLGPANDGGYYLLGMKSPCADLFDGISWSTDQVLKQTIAVIKSLDKTFGLLPELIDVDDENDWNQVKGNFQVSD